MVAAERDEGSCTMQGWSFCRSDQSAGGRWAVAVAFVVETATVVAIVIAGTEIVAGLAVGIGFVWFGNFRTDLYTQIALEIAPEVAIAGFV